MKVMFVCTGNICRSPTAEGILKKLAKENGISIEVSSSGIETYHEGEKPDYRAIKVAKENSVMLSDIRAKKITLEDVKNFDLIIGVTKKHVEKLKKAVPEEFRNKIKLFLEFTETENNLDNDIPDPYYGTEEDFKEVFDITFKACENLISKKLNLGLRKK